MFVTKLKARIKNLLGITRREWEAAYQDLEEEYGELAHRFDALSKQYDLLFTELQRKAAKSRKKTK